MKKRLMSILLILRTMRALLLVSGMVISLTLFTTGCSPKTGTSALWEVGDTRNKIVVISDIHLGIDDKYAETVENRPLLIDFLKRLQSTKDVRELVINGDFLDEWFLPVYYPSYTDVRQFLQGCDCQQSGCHQRAEQHS